MKFDLETLPAHLKTRGDRKRIVNNHKSKISQIMDLIELDENVTTFEVQQIYFHLFQKDISYIYSYNILKAAEKKGALIKIDSGKFKKIAEYKNRDTE